MNNLKSFVSYCTHVVKHEYLPTAADAPLTSHIGRTAQESIKSVYSYLLECRVICYRRRKLIKYNVR
jgi:hypothetical protein